MYVGVVAPSDARVGRVDVGLIRKKRQESSSFPAAFALVPEVGLEPTRLLPLLPENSASTNSATLALFIFNNYTPFYLFLQGGVTKKNEKVKLQY